MSFGEGSGTDFATARGRDWPSVRQFNIFLANRVGALVNVIRCFENTDVRIVSMTIIDTADCAIIRMVLSDPERAREIFDRAKLPVTEVANLISPLGFANPSCIVRDPATGTLTGMNEVMSPWAGGAAQ